MAAEIAKRDGDRNPVNLGATNDSNLEPRMLRVDPVTNRLLVDAGTISASSASVGTTGAAVPASGDYIAGNKAGNLTGLLIGQQAMASSLAVVLASDQASIPVAATLGAETTKVIGTINVAAGQTIGITANSSVNVAQINGVTPLMGNGATGTGSHRGTLANDNTGIANWGHGATAASVPAGATLGGLRGANANPTAVTNGQMVGAMGDLKGRLVAQLGHVRELRGKQTTTLSATTTETTIVTAAASTFNDLVALIISNTSASTNTRIDFRDTTAGTILFSLQVPANQTVGFSLAGASIPQTTVNTNWTAQCATSTTDIRILAIFEKNT